jgi:serine/threonine protein kinase
LADFGLSKQELDGTGLTYSVCGTPEYVAPEILTKKGHNKNIDWWSLGIILFEMYTGSTPNSGNTVPEIIKKLTSSEETKLDKLSGCSPQFLNLVSGLL